MELEKADLYNPKHALTAQIVEKCSLLAKGGILISCCQTHTISGDVVLSGKDDVPCGVF